MFETFRDRRIAIIETLYFEIVSIRASEAHDFIGYDSPPIFLCDLEILWSQSTILATIFAAL